MGVRGVAVISFNFFFFFLRCVKAVSSRVILMENYCFQGFGFREEIVLMCSCFELVYYLLVCCFFSGGVGGMDGGKIDLRVFLCLSSFVVDFDK